MLHSPPRRFTDAANYDETFAKLRVAGIQRPEAEAILARLKADEARVFGPVCRHCDDEPGGCSECDPEAHREHWRRFNRGR